MKEKEEAVVDVNVQAPVDEGDVDTPVESDPQVDATKEEIGSEKETEPIAEPEQEEGMGKRFEFGDIYFHCNQCGVDNKIVEAVRGISYAVPAAENSEVKMECTECGNTIKLYFKESSENAIKIRKLQIAEAERKQKEEQETPKENGDIQENREEESKQGDSDQSERVVEADEQAAGAIVGSDGAGQEVDV